MIRLKEEHEVILKDSPFNGEGKIQVCNLINKPEELLNCGRVFAHTTVYPGSSIGYHVHIRESELYYILKGKARFNDNGTMREIRAGDVTITYPGEGHGITTIGEEPVEMIALILQVNK
ncbi:cupin domain protein [Clostridiales bacterium 1_7_47FAA]|uniref:Cupin domain-containing protein n=1 Tax=Enterocloster hominis (ex Hitch et al. 2024) TaxID=1917870 RepID=A0ABV1DF97_9FIRM|nr:cupin domain protein [Clostridiales bacterium 1_7_47FAA]